MSMHPDPFRVKDEPPISIEAVRSILAAVNAESDFNEEQIQALQTSLERVRFQHRVEQRRVSPERNPHDIRERAAQISREAKKLVKLFDGETGRLVFDAWTPIFPYYSEFAPSRPPGLNDPSEHVPELDQLKAGLSYLVMVADYTAQFDDFFFHHADGGLIRFVVRLLEPLFQAHFRKPPTSTRGRKAGFPQFAVAVSKELNIRTVRNTVPSPETIIGEMSPSPKSNDD